MQFLVLMVLMTACAMDWPSSLDPLSSTVATATIVVASAVIMAWLSLDVRRRLRSGIDAEEVFVRYSRWRTRHLLGLLAAVLGALGAFGWGATAKALCTVQRDGHAWILPGAELLNLLPFVAGLVLAWLIGYDAERALYTATHPYRPFWGRWAYLSFQVRQNLALVFLPVGLYVGLQGLRRLLPDLDETIWVALSVGGLLAGLVTMPWWVRLIFGLRPLPPGLLRDRLERAARRLRLRYSDILLWPTRGGVANAMVVGVLPWPRYILLSDRLLQELTPEEVEAVFGHEAGHVAHGHIPYYLAFLTLSLMVLGGGFGLLIDQLHGPAQQILADSFEWLLMPVVGVYVFVVFGFLSRRCERQADVYGSRVVSCEQSDCLDHDDETALVKHARGLCATGIRTFISALEKVADINGLSRGRPSFLQAWQHGSISNRVSFLQRTQLTPGLERRFQRGLFQLKVVLLAGLLLALLSITAWDYRDFLRELWSVVQVSWAAG